MAGKRGRRDQAFEDFCANEYGRIVAAVALIVGNREVATDAVNEALARAWARIKRGATLDPFGGWVRVVAINIARDHIRHRNIEAKHAPTLVASESDNTEHTKWGLSLDVRNALTTLPTRQREVAVLHYLCDLSVSDIANELGIASGTVKTTLVHARIALKAALTDVSEGVGAP